VHHLRPAILAGILATVCGGAMAAPISLPLSFDFVQAPALPAIEQSVETRLIPSLDFPEAPDATFEIATDLPAAVSAISEAGSGGERVPEPPTALTFTAGLLLAGSVLALRSKILRREHRPFRRRVRREYRLMA
jgi:hypothetical protein